MAKPRARIGDDNNPLMKNKADGVLDGFEQVSQSTSQPADETTQTQQSSRRRRRSRSQADQPESQQVDKSKSQKASQSEGQPPQPVSLKKATYQIDAAVLEELDKAHLRLQLELGKKNTPYKEVIVEEAIARILAELEKNPARMQKVLVKRQGLR